MCSDKQDSNWHFTPINSIDVTKCNLEFTIDSPAGCIPVKIIINNLILIGIFIKLINEKNKFFYNFSPGIVFWCRNAL